MGNLISMDLCLVLLVMRYICRSNARAVKTNLTYVKTITIH